MTGPSVYRMYGPDLWMWIPKAGTALTDGTDLGLHMP